MTLVVAAVLVDELGTPTRILAARRRTPAALAGFWEFPGGKVEPGEDPVDALHRELAEELLIAVELGSELENPTGRSWPISADLEMRLWFAGINAGVPTATGSHDVLRWLTAAQLDDVPWLPADTTIVALLRE
ncbi:MAG TPA: (deoxy)nucleoside triphosphate pyrophosphohydrolase, partial [Propionibacteriaceae bacterium]|nr:(deoxy)nucleoside triphosphate pyrophosphohydrolase [Propionibacteriaceae bacterium]